MRLSGRNARHVCILQPFKIRAKRDGKRRPKKKSQKETKKHGKNVGGKVQKRT